MTQIRVKIDLNIWIKCRKLLDQIWNYKVDKRIRGTKAQSSVQFAAGLGNRRFDGIDRIKDFRSLAGGIFAFWCKGNSFVRAQDQHSTKFILDLLETTGEGWLSDIQKFRGFCNILGFVKSG